MKKIKEPRKDHWIYEHVITCMQCNGQFQCEEESDFAQYGLLPVEVRVTCPFCNYTQAVNKPWRDTQKTKHILCADDAEQAAKEVDDVFDDVFKKVDRIFEAAGPLWKSAKIIKATKTKNE